MGPDEPLLQRGNAVAARMATDYDIKKAQQTAPVDEVRVMGDHAYVRGTQNLSPTAASGAGTKGVDGKWSALFQRSAGGTWLISRWMWNQQAAPKAAGG